MSVHVLIADDQALVRAGFRRLLEAEEGIEVVGEAADAMGDAKCRRRYARGGRCRRPAGRPAILLAAERRRREFSREMDAWTRSGG